MAADMKQIRQMINNRRAGSFKPAKDPVPGLQVGNNSGGLEAIRGKLDGWPGAQKVAARMAVGASAVRSNPQAALQATRQKAASNFPNARLSPVTRAALQRRIQKARNGRNNSAAGAGFRAG